MIAITGANGKLGQLVVERLHDYAAALLASGLPQMTVDVIVDADGKAIQGSLDSTFKASPLGPVTEENEQFFN